MKYIICSACKKKTAYYHHSLQDVVIKKIYRCYKCGMMWDIDNTPTKEFLENWLK